MLRVRIPPLNTMLAITWINEKNKGNQMGTPKKAKKTRYYLRKFTRDKSVDKEVLAFLI